MQFDTFLIEHRFSTFTPYRSATLERKKNINGEITNKRRLKTIVKVMPESLLHYFYPTTMVSQSNNENWHSSSSESHPQLHRRWHI